MKAKTVWELWDSDKEQSYWVSLVTLTSVIDNRKDIRWVNCKGRLVEPAMYGFERGKIIGDE